MTYHYSQIQKKNQDQLVDQNFANNILFKNMSVLQTLQQNIKQQIGPKFFGAYDTIDYSNRPKQVLKEQLRLGLFQVQMSHEEFNKDYRNEFTLPKEYNMQRVLQRLNQFKQFFVQKQEAHIEYMVEDFINILEKRKGDRFYQTKKFQSGQSLGLAGNVKDMVKAGDYTQKEQEKMKKYFQKHPEMKPEDLPFKINQKFIKAESRTLSAKNLIEKEQEKAQGYNNKNYGLKSRDLSYQKSKSVHGQHKEVKSLNQREHKRIKQAQCMPFGKNFFYTGELNNFNTPHGVGMLQPRSKDWTMKGQFVNGQLIEMIAFKNTNSSKGLSYQLYESGIFIKVSKYA